MIDTIRFMEGSRSDGKTHWKQSVIRNNPVESRILAADKHLPNKFSPSRPVVSPKSKTLFRSTLVDYSHDDSKAQLRSNLPRSPSPRYNSEPTQEPTPLLPSQPRHESLSLIRQLKVEFNRFKEKTLGDIRHLEEDLGKAIREVKDSVGRSGPTVGSGLSLPQLSTPPSRPPLTQGQSKLNSHVEGASERRVVDLAGISQREINLRQVKQAVDSQRNEYSTLTPQIRSELERFQQLIGNLKTHLAQPAPA